jgi:hypothetical protein
VRLFAFAFALVAGFVAAFIEVTAARHLKAAPFALDGVQAANVLGDPPLLGFLLRFHGCKVSSGVGQRLSSLRLIGRSDTGFQPIRDELYCSWFFEHKA